MGHATVVVAGAVTSKCQDGLMLSLPSRAGLNNPLFMCVLSQLKSPGRMVIPVGPDGGEQVFLRVDKDAAGVVTRR